MIYEDVVIKKFEPKWAGDPETGEKFGVLVFNGELKAKSREQIADFYDGFQKQLIKVSLESYDQFDSKIEFVDVSLNNFKVQTKMERIGKGREVELIPVEIVKFQMSVKMDVEGNYLKELYSFFLETVKMEIS